MALQRLAKLGGGSSARNGGKDGGRLRLDFSRREAEDPDAFLRQPGGSALVADLLIVVGRTIDFYGKLPGGAVEVENVGADRVLAAKVQAEFVAAKQRPQGAFGLRRSATHLLRAITDEVG